MKKIFTDNLCFFCAKNKSIWVIWLIFTLSTLFVGYHHEPWADEAQAWLIARDATTWEILSQFARCEGQPPLWHLLLHLLIEIGLPYTSFYLIPWIINSLGVLLFLWKAPFPKWIKSLLPFTYFIFFQYTIIARQYCFILLFLSLISMSYFERHRKPFLYALVLSLFGFSATPALLIAGSLYFLFLCENLHLSEKRKENWLASGIIFVFMLAVVTILLPDLDNPFPFRYRNISTIKTIFVSLPTIISIPFFHIDLNIPFSRIIFPTFTILFIISFFWRNKKNLVYVSILYGPLLIFFSLVHFHIWLLGYLFLLFFFCLWIFYDRNLFTNFKKNIRLWFLLSLFLLHMSWTIRCCLYDILFSYSAASEVAQFIEPYVKKNKSIVATSFWSVSIQPYFSNNIFKNYEKGFWFYKRLATQYHLLSTLSEGQFPDIIIFYPDLIGQLGAVEEVEFLEKCQQSGLYAPAEVFPAYMITKNFSESQSIAVYVKKTLKKGGNE